MTIGESAGRGQPVNPNVNPARPTLLKDASFRIHALTTVGVRIEYGDPKHPTVLSSLDDGTPLTTSLNESVGISVIEDLGDGNVSVALSSSTREHVKSDRKKLENEDSALADDLVGLQPDLEKVLTKKGVRPGSLVRIVLTAPASSLY